jgi:hypothetical protein
MRNHFTPPEDRFLSALVDAYGQGDWEAIAARMMNRTARQCRERWSQYLAPSVVRSPWTAEEDALLLEKVRQYGPQWKRLEAFFPGRKDNHLKNHHKLLVRRGEKVVASASTPSDSIVPTADHLEDFADEEDGWGDLALS